MTNHLASDMSAGSPGTLKPITSFARGIMVVVLATLGVCWLLLLAGCNTTPVVPEAAQLGNSQTGSAQVPDVLTLKEGDILKVSFASIPTMDSTQPIRQDGRITLPLIGEMKVAGKTTDALNAELVEIYGTKLVSKDVSVSLVASPFTIYVTGAVLHPGKIVTDRRITAFDAIMEAGGFDKAKADLKKVVVVRQEEGQTRSFEMNIQQVLGGGQNTPFYLKPFDTVYVPEKFSWF